ASIALRPYQDAMQAWSEYQNESDPVKKEAAKARYEAILHASGRRDQESQQGIQVLGQIRQRLHDMQQAEGDNPSLRKDPNFQAEKRALNDALTRGYGLPQRPSIP